MNTPPRISVLMPAYNALPYIREAVDSVVSQECSDWELVISDNGSTDGTLDYYESLRDERIRVFRQPQNLGVYGNLNFLLLQARAPIAQILCADDTLLPGALEQIAKFMEQRPQCALSRCWALGHAAFYGPEGLAHVQGSLPTSLRPRAAALAYATFGNPVGNLSQAAIRPELVKQVGQFDATLPYMGDREFWARVSRRYGLELQNTELVMERTHPQQNRNLLSRNYENTAQADRVLSVLQTLVEKSDLPVLRRHWTAHFLSPRVPATVREIVHGQLGRARDIWKALPREFSPVRIFLAYPFWKLGMRNRSTDELMRRILVLNQDGTA